MRKHTEHIDLLSALSKNNVGVFKHVRYAPTSFDPADPAITVFPYARETWESAERAFHVFSSRLVMARFPYFWQMHSLLHAACRRASAVLYINVLTNTPLGLAAIQEVSVDTIVSGLKAAELFAHELHNANMLDKLSWLIIHDACEDWLLPAILKTSRGMAQEVHLFPGIVLLEQCEDLMETMSSSFHLHESLAWELEGERVFISGGEPVPFERYMLPFSLMERGICRCGKTLYEKST